MAQQPLVQRKHVQTQYQILQLRVAVLIYLVVLLLELLALLQQAAQHILQIPVLNNLNVLLLKMLVEFLVYTTVEQNAQKELVQTLL